VDKSGVAKSTFRISTGNLKLLTDEIEREIPQLKVIRPEGTFFVWLDCTSLGLDPHQLSDFMTNKAKFALESGYWFVQEAKDLKK